MEKNADSVRTVPASLPQPTASASAHTAPPSPPASAQASLPTAQPFLQYIKNELYRSELLSPMIKRVLWMLLPYGIGFILLNFFTTLLAVGLVIYVHRRHV